MVVALRLLRFGQVKISRTLSFELLHDLRNPSVSCVTNMSVVATRNPLKQLTVNARVANVGNAHDSNDRHNSSEIIISARGSHGIHENFVR